MARKGLWLAAAGVAQVVLAPLLLLGAQLLPKDEDTRFLVFFPGGFDETRRFDAVLKAEALPLSVGWHGGWIVEAGWENAVQKLKNNGAYLVLSGEGLAACGTEQLASYPPTKTPYYGE